MRFTDRVAVVTAGGSGMGRASALRLAAEGAAVIVADIDAAAAQETVDLMGPGEGSGEAFAVDVADLDRLRALFDHVERHYGALHVLFNNAGIPGHERVRLRGASPGRHHRLCLFFQRQT